MPDARTDAELIEASLRDPEAFEGVFRRHYQPIRRYLQRRLGSDVGEELGAQTFLVAFERRASYDMAYPSARPWLFAIATNLLRHHARDEQRHREILQRESRLSLGVMAADDDRMIIAHTIPLVFDALASLDERDREALLLYGIADLSYEDIASVLAIPKGTVRSRIHRARRILREHLPPLKAIMIVADEGPRDG